MAESQSSTAGPQAAYVANGVLMREGSNIRSAFARRMIGGGTGVSQVSCPECSVTFRLRRPEP